MHEPKEFIGSHSHQKVKKLLLATLSKFLVDKAQAVR
jgi:hypothetical protein